MHATPEEFSRATCCITTDSERICRWRWIRQTRNLRNHRSRARWSNFRRSVVCTVITSGWRHDTGEPMAQRTTLRIFGKDRVLDTLDEPSASALKLHHRSKRWCSHNHVCAAWWRVPRCRPASSRLRPSRSRTRACRAVYVRAKRRGPRRRLRAPGLYAPRLTWRARGLHDLPQRPLRSAPAARIGRWSTREQPRSRAIGRTDPASLQRCIRTGCRRRAH